VRLEVIPWPGAATPDEATLRRRLEADGFDVFAWQDGPDARYTAHHHDHDESIWVVDGELTFGIDGRSYRLGPGDRLMLPARTVHTAAGGPTGAAYLIGQRR
jgi:quercetin dioxygenase-like cupin family protein